MARIAGEHTSLWATDAERQSYPPLDDDVSVDVVVVGGGWTGMATAAMCKDEGASVAVIEARELASGTSGGTTGKLTSQHELFYASAIERLGEDRARTYADANQAALGIVEQLADRHDVDAYLSRLPSYVFTRDGANERTISDEVDAARRLGLPASLETDIGLPFDVAAAVKFDDQLQIHPVRLVNGLARAVDGDGSSVHEHTRAVEVSERDGTVVVRTDRATVHARHGVIATLLPITDRGFEFAKVRPTRSYAVAVRLRDEPPEPMYLSVDSPTRSLRHYHGNDGTYLVVVGESHETGHGDDLERHYHALAEFAHRHFDVDSVAYRWSAQDYMPVDGVPYVGRLNLTEHVHVATGFKKWGLSNGVVAARIMTDAIVGRDNDWADVFDADRHQRLGDYAELIEDNLHVARRFAADRLVPPATSVEGLGPGSGTVVRTSDGPTGVCRTRDGAVIAVSAVCTHLACLVQWNDAEESWDCPCHGSRFDASGQVIAGPAVRPLATADVPAELDGS